MSYPSIDAIAESLRPGAHPSARQLYAMWGQRVPVATKTGAAEGSGPAPLRWLQSDLALAAAFIEEALQREEFLLVCDVHREATAHWRHEPNIPLAAWVKVHRHHATAQVRLGFTREARRGLEPLAGNRELSARERAQIFLQLGDIVREESHHAAAPAVRFQAADDARKLYQQALALEPGLIEARLLNAAMALIISEPGTPARAEAAQLGGEVLALLRAGENASGATFRTTWFTAVAQSIMGRLDEAAASYGKLDALPDATTSALAEARYRAQFLAEALGRPRPYFKPAFPPLELIVFTGHNADRPGTPARFPAESIPAVREILRKKLDQVQARAGIANAAAGTDLLFFEAMQARPGAACHVVLPWSQPEFYRVCVEPCDAGLPAPIWTPLFEQALDQATTVRELGQVFEPVDNVGWQFAQEATAGMALLTARVSRLDVRPMALWDGLPGRGAGGTDSFVQFWSHTLQQPPVLLDWPGPARPSAYTGRGESLRSEQPSMHQVVKSMLFADIVGYSKLAEKVIRDFVEIFMQKVSSLLVQNRHAPSNVNTWGDAVYAVFDYAEDAGRFALQLTQLIREGEKEWMQRGLFYEEIDEATGKVVARPLNVRIGLHTGPVFAHYNPILRELDYTGTHVNRAARIESVAAPGEVFASEEFAAMAELGDRIKRCQLGGEAPAIQGDGFDCEFAGTMTLAKNLPGRFRIYRVIPSRVLAMEELAMAVHTLYCEEQRKQGATPELVPALRPWAELNEDQRDANRAQVADIPNKLLLLGYELSSSHGISPTQIQISREQLEELSIREHQRWMTDRQRHGWTYGPVRDNMRRLHPSLIPWEALTEPEKQKDRDTVFNIPKLIEQAGFRVRPAASG